MVMDKKLNKSVLIVYSTINYLSISIIKFYTNVERLTIRFYMDKQILYGISRFKNRDICHGGII